MGARAPSLRQPVRDRAGWLICGILLAVITALRIAVSNPIEAVGFLYVIPISMLAARRGILGGLLTATGAMGCTAFWVLLQHVSLGVVGYGARAATFASVAVLVGLETHRRRRLESDRERLIDELHVRSMRDDLTGVANRPAWDAHIAELLRAADRSRRPLSVAVIDLDRLKRINDTHGHERGDRLIQRCAHAWSGALRGEDFLARLGGDEFLVAMPSCPGADAEEVARRLLGAVPFNQTCSIGVATWDGLESAAELVRRADQAMYRAKAAGGGRTELATPGPGDPSQLVGELPV